MGIGGKKVTPQGASQDGVVTHLQENESLTNELKTDSGVRSDYMAYVRDRDGVTGGGHTMGVGTTDSTKIRLNSAVRYRIDGVEYIAEIQEVDLATGEITGSKWGAWRFTANKLGVVGTQRATANGTSGTMAFDNEQDALLSLSQIARTANTVDIGYLSIDAAAGGFTPGTDDPDAGDVTVDANNYYDVRVPQLDNGFTAAPSVGLSEGTNDDEYAYGTINVRTNGLNIAQIAADTTAPFADADIVTTSGNFGGQLLVTDLAKTSIISLASTGIAGAVQTVDFSTLALATTDLDAVQLALPRIFTVIGRLTYVTAKATHTLNTDDLAGTDATATWTDEVATAYSRLVTSGTGVGPAPPTIPPATAASALNLDA